MVPKGAVSFYLYGNYKVIVVVGTHEHLRVQIARNITGYQFECRYFYH